MITTTATNVYEFAQIDTQLKKKSRNEYSGPCPNPACNRKNDGFVVRFKNDQWRFMCRGCWNTRDVANPETGREKGWGDEIDYLCQMRQMNIEEALQLALQEGMIPFEKAYKKYAAYIHVPYEVAAQKLRDFGVNEAAEAAPSMKNAPRLDDWRNPRWQVRVSDAVKEYELSLWSEAGAQALSYIRGRGLADDTIKKAHIGFSNSNGIPRLVIPSYNENYYLTVYRRDLRADCDKGERWREIIGAKSDEFYLADCLQRDLPTVLVESAIDALTIVQQCGDIVNVVATGGADRCKLIENVAKIIFKPLVMIAFDADQAGDEHSTWWLARIPNSLRLRPAVKDVNDMHFAGWDIRAWILDAVQSQISDGKRAEQSMLDISNDEEDYSCILCTKKMHEHLDQEFVFNDQGDCYCMVCFELLETGLEPVSEEEGMPKGLRSILATLADTFHGIREQVVLMPGRSNEELFQDRCAELSYQLKQDERVPVEQLAEQRSRTERDKLIGYGYPCQICQNNAYKRLERKTRNGRKMAPEVQAEIQQELEREQKRYDGFAIMHRHNRYNQKEIDEMVDFFQDDVFFELPYSFFNLATKLNRKPYELYLEMRKSGQLDAEYTAG